MPRIGKIHVHPVLRVSDVFDSKDGKVLSKILKSKKLTLI